jgi:hypothetical protein
MTWVEGRDRANTFDLVGVAARFHQPFAEQSDAWSVAEQQQALRSRKANVLTGELGRSAGRR